MAYFNNDPQDAREEDYQPVFQQPVEDDFAGDANYGDPQEEYYTGEVYDEEYLTEEERREARQMKWKMLAGVGDFIGVLAGTVVILLLVALLINLITWVQSDISQSFTLWQTKL
ncbi:MAG: hypothetical protein E7316_01625 [Clostridiales bacterium]|nr:hypothetical protein [Clostridiales bacterium]